jgi:hypothetical protein
VWPLVHVMAVLLNPQQLTLPTGLTNTPAACRPGACIVSVRTGQCRSRPRSVLMNVGQLPVVRVASVCVCAIQFSHKFWVMALQCQPSRVGSVLF